MRSSIGKEMTGAGLRCRYWLGWFTGATCEASRNMSANGRDAQEKIASVAPTCRGAHSLFSSMLRIATSNGRDERTAKALAFFRQASGSPNGGACALHGWRDAWSA